MLQDFGDGGAYPEIPVAQYPGGAGKSGSGASGSGSSGTALPVQLDAEGNIRYDVIAKVGHGKDKVRL